MAKKGLYKYRQAGKKRFLTDIAVMTAGVMLGLLVIFAIYQLNDIFGNPGQSIFSGLHGSAPESGNVVNGGTRNLPNSTMPAVSPTVESAKNGNHISIKIQNSNGYGVVGQTDVNFFKLDLTSSATADLRQIGFDLDGYAGVNDVNSLQLYYEGKLVGQAPVSNTKAVFDKMDIRLSAGQTASFEVKGNIGGQAVSGDRVQVGIKDPSEIQARDAQLNDMEVNGEFPLWSGYISIIGNKIKK